MGRMRTVLSGRVLVGGRRLEAGSVVVEDGRLVAVRPGLGGEGGDGWTVAPGFVDLQVNGFAGRDAAEGAEAVEAIAAALPATGVTGFLATLVSSPAATGARFVEAAAAVRAPGAAVLGAHLEGPFLSRRHPGVHDPRQLREPTAAALDEVLRRPPRLVTLAPELPGARAAIERLAAAGVVVSLGHSAATAAEARAGFAAGARLVTHLFNAMAPLHHRELGLAGAALEDGRVTAAVIADGVHVDLDLVRMIVRLKGPRRVALTTDQTAAAGAPPGHYRLGGMEVESDGTAVRRADGALAGSAASMDAMVRGLVRAGVGLEAAITMASATPRRVLGLRRGGRADLVLLDPSLRVRLTIARGEVVFRG